jgi:hypothetical protein
VGHTGSGRPAQAAVASVLGEHTAAQILRRPVADTECTVALQVVVGAAAAAETSPAGHVAAAVAAVADAADAAVVAAAIENFVSLHSHSSHIKPTAQVEDVAVKARVPALVQRATVDYMLVVLEVGQPRRR